MNRIVDVKEAILAYLDGKKVRRYMPYGRTHTV